MAEELLDLVQGHAGVQQHGRDARPQAVRGDVLVDARPLGGVFDQPLNVPRSVFVRAVALEHIAVAPATKVRAEFLRQSRQDWNVAVASALSETKVSWARCWSMITVDSRRSSSPSASHSLCGEGLQNVVPMAEMLPQDQIQSVEGALVHGFHCGRARGALYIVLLRGKSWHGRAARQSGTAERHGRAACARGGQEVDYGPTELTFSPPSTSPKPRFAAGARKTVGRFFAPDGGRAAEQAERDP